MAFGHHQDLVSIMYAVFGGTQTGVKYGYTVVGEDNFPHNDFIERDSNWGLFYFIKSVFVFDMLYLIIQLENTANDDCQHKYSQSRY
jgi:hypothetical protein